MPASLSIMSSIKAVIALVMNELRLNMMELRLIEITADKAEWFRNENAVAQAAGREAGRTERILSPDQRHDARSLAVEAAAVVAQRLSRTEAECLIHK